MNPQRLAVALVERDTDTCELYRRQLTQAYTVFPCVDVPALDRAMHHQRLDLIVIEPAGFDGQVLHILGGAIPLLVCSTSETCDPAIRRRAMAYLVKPVLPLTLQQTIRQVLDAIDQQDQRLALALRVQTEQ